MNSPIIKRSRLQPAGTSPAGGTTSGPSTTSASPAPRIETPRCKKSATLVESGGRPVAIEVTCSCGETTLVELDYAAPPAAPAPNTNEERKVP